MPIEFKVTLRHSWARCVVDVGDVVRIVGKFCKTNNYSLSLDDLPVKNKEDAILKGRFLVLEPDILIASTSISTATPWARVPLLKELFKNTSDIGYPLVLGNIVHLLFQKILENTSDLYIEKNQHKLEQTVNECIKDHLIDLYFIRKKVDEDKLNEDLQNGKSFQQLDNLSNLYSNMNGP